MATEKLYVISEISKELRVDYRSVQRYLYSKQIIGHKIGNKWQVTEQELNYIKSNGLRPKKK